MYKDAAHSQEMDAKFGIGAWLRGIGQRAFLATLSSAISSSYSFLPLVECTSFGGISLNGLGVEGWEADCDGVGGCFIFSAKPSEMSSLRIAP